jgi:hypothetical protein
MTHEANTMYAIYALHEGTFSMATFEVFEDIHLAESKIIEMKAEAADGVRFFIESSRKCFSTCF